MNCCRGVSLHPGGTSNTPAAAVALFVDATPNTVANVLQVYTTPSAYVSGTLTVFDSSVLIPNSALIELSPTTFRFAVFVPIAGHTLRCVYEEP